MSSGGEKVQTDDWKVFRKDTQAGRLLSRLYGNSNSTVSGQTKHISYPKLKKKKDEDTVEDLSTRSRWGSGLAQQQTQSQRSAAAKKREKAASVRIPKVGNGRRKTNGNGNSKQKHLSIHAVPRRKTQSSCNHKIEEHTLARKSYRPPNQMARTNDEEKEKLCKDFEVGGGKCLPLELTALPSTGDDESEVGERDNNNAAHVLRESDRTLPFQEKMAHQIATEIKERIAFQYELELNGSGEGRREAIVDEITTRMRELMQIDPHMAKRMMNE